VLEFTPSPRFRFRLGRCLSYDFVGSRPLPTLSQSGVCLRHYHANDRSRVFQLLSFLPTLYPGGFAWLDGRLREVLDGKARCTLAVKRSEILGITIETPKSAHCVKLSTVFVRPEYRGGGVGRALLNACHDHWQRDSISRCYVTADYRVADHLGKLLRPFCFERTCLVQNRYGEGRDEVIFCWDSARLDDFQH
jgi:GNAT superfamily N-acetyltransferase